MESETNLSGLGGLEQNYPAGPAWAVDGTCSLRPLVVYLQDHIASVQQYYNY